MPILTLIKKKFEGMKTNRESGNGPQSIGDILKNCLQQNSDYENSSNAQKYKKLEDKVNQLSKQVEQIRIHINTIARHLNSK